MHAAFDLGLAVAAFATAVKNNGIWVPGTNFTADVVKRYREQYEYLGFVRDKSATVSRIMTGPRTLTDSHVTYITMADCLPEPRG
jgi:hypothetical protein